MTSPDDRSDPGTDGELAELESLLRERPDDVGVLLRAGDLLFARSQFERAGDAYRDASHIALERDDADEIDDVMTHVEAFLRDTNEAEEAVAARASLTEWMAERGWSLKHEPVVRSTPRVGRNDPCPCGSGRKYKKCHGASV